MKLISIFLPFLRKLFSSTLFLAFIADLISNTLVLVFKNNKSLIDAFGISLENKKILFLISSKNDLSQNLTYIRYVFQHTLQYYVLFYLIKNRKKLKLSTSQYIIIFIISILILTDYD